MMLTMVRKPHQRLREAPMADDPTDHEPTYTVGYAKPPAHSRFQPGQSGNPKGKKKGQKSLKGIIATVLREKVTVRTSRGQKRMMKMEAIVHTAVSKALTGDRAALEQVIKLAREVGLADEATSALEAASMLALGEEDRAILERIMGRNSNAGGPD